MANCATRAVSTARVSSNAQHRMSIISVLLFAGRWCYEGQYSGSDGGDEEEQEEHRHDPSLVLVLRVRGHQVGDISGDRTREEKPERQHAKKRFHLVSSE